MGAVIGWPGPGRGPWRIRLEPSGNPNHSPELRRRAKNLFKGERPEHTLSATAVVNEVYLRLVDAGQVEWIFR